MSIVRLLIVPNDLPNDSAENVGGVQRGNEMESLSLSNHQRVINYPDPDGTLWAGTGEPNMKEKWINAIRALPKLLSYILLAVVLITIIVYLLYLIVADIISWL